MDLFKINVKYIYFLNIHLMVNYLLKLLMKHLSIMHKFNLLELKLY